MSSDGRVAIVTGAAQGIGYAICDRLLQEGYRVCLADINEEQLKGSFAELKKKHGLDKVSYVKCDISSETNFEEVFTRTVETFGRIDLLVNNAGIADESNPRRTVEVNLLGTIFGTHLALKFMGTKNGGKGGVVVNTASICGFLSIPHLPVYAATKHGIIGLTRSYGAKSHLDSNGVMFMAVCPGSVETPLKRSIDNQGILKDDKFAKKDMPPEFIAEGVMKLLKDKINGSTMIVLPERFIYIEIQDELKNLEP